MKKQFSFHALLVWVTVVSAFSCYLLCFLPIYLAGAKKRQDRLLRLSQHLVKRIFRSMGIELEVSGLEYLPKQGFVLACNHQSLLDIVVLMASLPIPIRFLAKKELKRVPILGFVLMQNGNFIIDRQNPRVAVQQLKLVQKYLLNNGALAVFPEGTRSCDGQLKPFKMGALKVAMNTDTDVVACCIKGSGSLLPKGCVMPKKGKIKVCFAPKLNMKDFKKKYPGQETLNLLSTELHETVKSLLLTQ